MLLAKALTAPFHASSLLLTRSQAQIRDQSKVDASRPQDHRSFQTLDGTATLFLPPLACQTHTVEMGQQLSQARAFELAKLLPKDDDTYTYWPPGSDFRILCIFHQPARITHNAMDGKSRQAH